MCIYIELYQPMMHTLRHELAIRIYMGLLILGVNTVYIAFCFARTLAMVGKGLRFKSYKYCIQYGKTAG